jgi:CBS domain containing-hemolysin-like protein
VNNIPLIVVSIFILLGLNLLIAATRTALLNTRLSKIDSLGETDAGDLGRLRKLIARRARVRAAHKLTQTMLRFLILGLLLVLLYPTIQGALNTTYLLLLVVFSGLVMWLGEFTIEGVILKAPEEWALRLQSVGQVLVSVLYPILAIPLRLAKSSEATRNLVTITEDELMSLVDASQQAGQIDTEAREMIHNVFQLDDTLAREIMIPRVDALMLDQNTPLDEAADAILESGYSRVPVFEESQDNIIGILYTKDLIRVWREDNGINSLGSLIRPAYFVPETKNVLELLNEMQAQRIHLAIVVDEYGGIAGLVTLEDIVEEIFGEIQDEFDDAEEDLFERITDEEYVFNGRMTLHDVNELMNVDLDDEDADTLGGLIYSRTGHVPEIGEKLREDGVMLTVEEITDRRIRKVRAVRIISPDNTYIESESTNE